MSFSETVKSKLPEIDAMKFDNCVAKRTKCSPNLAVTAFVHNDTPGSSFVISFFQLQFTRAIFQLHAIIANHLLMKRCKRLVEFYFVGLVFMKFRMCHPVGKVAIIRE